ncbi:VWA domain-containing protein [Lysobacter sp. A3-1-A15]|uniref:VWA domain-containing protein n=3 Tax=Novilysobacter viscosus TaxID=3098602 RepID=UPI003983D637
MMQPLMDAIAGLHLLRPEWLWALLALPAGAWLWNRRRHQANVWRNAVDPHLLAHLVEGGVTPARQSPLWLGAILYLIAVVALAGPSWRQVEQPLWQSRMPLVVALDLSRATLATDLPPTRLAQARAKLEALLRDRAGGQVGLVAFAEDAFTVSPLTADPANVAIFLDALHPDVMPVDGQRPDRAIVLATRLLRQAGFDRGQILLMTDGADARTLAAASRAASEGYTVSVLGLGRAAGGSYGRAGGGVATARLDPGSLERMAAQGQGRYVAVAADDGDLRALDVLDPAQTTGDTQAGLQGRTWVDDGYWLLPPLMLLSLWLLRRRAGAAVVVLALGLASSPVRAQADDGSWWQRPDQARHEVLQQGTQAYREGDFDRAAALYRQVDSADGHYNRGNALAKAGNYEAAIAAYDRALALQPGMPDALANRQAVEAAMRRKPPSGGDDGRSDGEGDPGSGGSPQPGEANPDAPPQGGQQEAEAEPSDAPDEQRDDPGESETGAQAADEAAAEAQRQADAAQRERMQRALEQAGEGEQPAQGQAPVNETAAEREQRLANEAWLRRVPDDPGGLLREKFRLEHERRRMRGLREDDDR